MPITDRTRKILWARSGNRCAICRQVLVLDETARDPEAIVADECHIVSAAPNGPRYDPYSPAVEVDRIENLVLLCAVHHRMVDSQPETYSADLLRQIKKNHEAWTETKLKQDAHSDRPRLRRFKENIPKQLKLVGSGRQLTTDGPRYHGCYQRHPERLSEDEVEMVGGFLQEVEEYMSIADDLDALDRLRTVKAIDEHLDRLKEHGFLVFSGVERQRMEGGFEPPSDWFMLHLAVERVDDLIAALDERAKGEAPKI